MTAIRDAYYARMRRRIMRNVEIVGECWIWRGRRNNLGYGVMSCRMPGYRHPRVLFVHRVAWEAFRRRRMPRGRVGAHSYRCHSNACANFEHIRATTQAHNERDKRRAKLWRARNVRIEFPPTHTITKGAFRT